MCNVLDLVCEYHNFGIYKNYTQNCYSIGTRFKIVYSYFTSIESAKDFIKEIYKEPAKYIEDLIK